MRTLAAVLVLTLGSGVAYGQRRDAVARARPHFEAAQQYYSDGQYAAALREFRTAHDLTHHPELLYNIALCYERLGDFANAASTLEQYLASEEEVAERAEASQRLERLRRGIAQRAELEPTRERPNETQPSPPAHERSAPRTPPVTPSAELPIGPIVAFSAAGALLITGIVLGASAVAKHDSLAAQCGDLGCSEAQIDELRALTISTDVMLSAAAAAAVVGVVLLIVMPPGAQHASNRPLTWRF